MKKGVVDDGAYPRRERKERGGNGEAMNAVPEENRRVGRGSIPCLCGAALIWELT